MVAFNKTCSYLAIDFVEVKSAGMTCKRADSLHPELLRLLYKRPIALPGAVSFVQYPPFRKLVLLFLVFNLHQFYFRAWRPPYPGPDSRCRLFEPWQVIREFPPDFLLQGAPRLKAFPSVIWIKPLEVA